MNNVFDIRRFGKYLAYDLRRIRSSYGLTFLILALMPVVIYTVTLAFGMVNGNGWAVPNSDSRLAVFFITTGVLLLSYPASCYGSITAKKPGSSWLLLPASSFEKFLSLLLITLIVLPVAYAVLYFGSDALLGLAGHGYGQGIATRLFVEKMSVNVTSGGIEGTGGSAYPLYLVFITTALTFMLGAVLFKKFKVALTILCLMALSMVLSLVGVFVATHTDAEWWKNLFTWVIGEDEDTVLRRMKILANVSAWVVIALLGLGTFFRIKTLKH